MPFLFDGAYFELAGHKIWEKSVEDIICSFQRPCLNSLGGFGRQLEKTIKASQMSWSGGRQARKDEAEIRKQVFGYRGLYRHSPGGWWAPLVPGGTSSLPQKPRRGGTASSCRLGTRYEPHTVEHRVSESHYEPVPKDGISVFARPSLRTPCMIRPSCCGAYI